MPDVDDLISFALFWLLIGSAIWAFSDPSRYADFVTRAYVKRRGRLPSSFVMLVSHLVAIVKWPKMARELWWRA